MRSTPLTFQRGRKTVRRVAVLAAFFLAAGVFLVVGTFNAKAAPTIEIINPPNGATISGVTEVRVRLTDSTGLNSVSIHAGTTGHFATNISGTSFLAQFAWDTTKENNGNAAIDVECYNSNSEPSYASRGVKINNIKGPQISWQTPAADQQFLPTITATTAKAIVSKGEGSNINRIRFWIDANLIETRNYSPAVSSTTYTKTVDLTGLSVGSGHTLKIEARNTDGGITTSTRKIYRVSEYVVRYLAEGSTDWGYSCYISIENPNTSAVTAKVTYQTKSGPKSRPNLVLPAKSQTTLNPSDDIGATDFSTRVDCLEGKTIAVDRTMIWGGGAESEAHSSIGVPSPAKTWYLPEGSSKWGFECWLLIQNPNAQTANVTLTYMIEGEGPRSIPVSVPGNSRATFNMADHIGQKDASIKVTSSVPVIPERAMYRNNRREGHDSIGTTSPANDFYLAEGTTAYGFTTYVLVQNPSGSPVDIDVTYMTPGGPRPQPRFQMPANSRKTIRVNDVLPGTDLSTKVHGSQPIIAERAMYWDNGTGEACHDSIGMDSPHTTFYLPDGESSNGRETWTLVQNPNGSAVSVKISYLLPEGGEKTLTDSVPANSRKTYFMANTVPDGRAALMVSSLTSGKKIMVERAMYWNDRGAGTDTIGGYGD